MHRLSVWLVFCALPLPTPLRAAEPTPEDPAQAVAPYLDPQSYLVVYADLSRVDLDALAARVSGALPPVSARELAEAKPRAAAWLRAFRKAGGREAYLVFSLADLGQKTPCYAVVPLPPGANGIALASLLVSGRADGPTRNGEGGPFAQAGKVGNAVVAASGATLERVRAMKAVDRPDVARAFAAVGGAPLRVALVPSAETRRVAEEQATTLPPELHGGSIKVLTRGLLWAGLGLHVPPRVSLQVTLHTQDEVAARAIHGWFRGVLQAVSTRANQDPSGFRIPVPNLEEVVKVVLPQVEGSNLTLQLSEKQSEELLGLLRRPGQQVQSDQERLRSLSNLKQLAHAAHRYYDAYNTFPAAGHVGRDGKPLLSWRVHLLPYLDQEELYRQFRLDEPWDSDHNKKLIIRMPEAFKSPRQRSPTGTTTYLAVVGDGTVFTGKPKGTRFQEIVDGTSNTALFVEAADHKAVIWTKPEDLPYEPRTLLSSLLGHYEGGFLVAFCDGSARFVSSGIDPKVLQGLVLKADGHPVQVP